jgi:hypothetical protein
MLRFSSLPRAALQPLLDSVLALGSPLQRRHWLASLRGECPRVTRDLEALLRELDANDTVDDGATAPPCPGSLESLGLRH